MATGVLFKLRRRKDVLARLCAAWERGRGCESRLGLVLDRKDGEAESR